MTEIKTTGHSAKNPGLRGHSIGPLYPAIISASVSTAGVIQYRVMLHGHETIGMAHKEAIELAQDCAALLDMLSTNTVLALFKMLEVYGGKRY